MAWCLHFATLLFLLLGAAVSSFSSTTTKSFNPIPSTRLQKTTNFRRSPSSTLLVTSPETRDSNNEESGFLFSIPRPTLVQGLSAWLVFIAGNRMFQSIQLFDSGGDDIANKLLQNIAFNGLLFVGGAYTLIKTLVGIDYDTLEDFDTKSWAREAGKYALQGTVPSEYVGDDGKVYQVATFAGGCFWGTELRFQRQVGVIATAVGYTQGNIDRPNYDQVCSGSTGHAEGIQVIYDPTECSYERLVAILLDSINPTLLNQVGNDRGTQYRHGIYPHTVEQMKIAKEAVQARQAQYSQPVVTEIKHADIFWPAENYHQRYLEKGGQSAAKNCEETVRCYG